MKSMKNVLATIRRVAPGAAATLLSAAVVYAAVGGAQQASITLKGSAVALCQHNDGVSWNLTKRSDVTDDILNNEDVPGTITWTVTATKSVDQDAPNILAVNGFVSVTNGGGAPATIGNIIVNLQRKVGTKWKSAAVNVATGSSGDAATSAKVVAGVSSEVPPYPADYSVSGGVGTFVENSGSGALEFTDSDSNTIFSLVPQPAIPVGATVNLLFTANFDNSILGIPTGEQVRAEVIVTFGNSGGRGGSGATGNNIDINGNGVSDADEANVRSVPTRITTNVPALEICNDEVFLADDGPVASGNVALSDGDDGGIESGVWIGSDNPTGGTYTYIVSTNVAFSDPDLDPAAGGTVQNCATIYNEEYGVWLIVGYTSEPIVDPVTGEITGYVPDLEWFQCCKGTDANAFNTVIVAANPVIIKCPGMKGDFCPGDYCTASQGGFGGPGKPYNYLVANWATAFPTTGVQIGIPGGVSAQFTTPSAVQAYLPATGVSKVLTADLIDPTSTSAGNIGGQILTLSLNVGLNPAFGNLVLTGTGGSLDGKTVSEILAVANTAIGTVSGTAVPSGYTFGTLNDLVTKLNVSFDQADINGKCIPTPWAVDHLRKPAAP